MLKNKQRVSHNHTMVSTKDFSYLTLRLSLLNPGNVGRIRTGTGTSMCPACMYYKTKSIATFTVEQYINSILYYHCAHSNHLMLSTLLSSRPKQASNTSVCKRV